MLTPASSRRHACRRACSARTVAARGCSRDCAAAARANQTARMTLRGSGAADQRPTGATCKKLLCLFTLLRQDCIITGCYIQTKSIRHTLCLIGFSACNGDTPLNNQRTLIAQGSVQSYRSLGSSQTARKRYLLGRQNSFGNRSLSSHRNSFSLSRQNSVNSTHSTITPPTSFGSSPRDEYRQNNLSDPPADVETGGCSDEEDDIVSTVFTKAANNYQSCFSIDLLLQNKYILRTCMCM